MTKAIEKILGVSRAAAIGWRCSIQKLMFILLDFCLPARGKRALGVQAWHRNNPCDCKKSLDPLTMRSLNFVPMCLSATADRLPAEAGFRRCAFVPLLIILNLGLWLTVSAQTTAQAEKMLSIVLQQKVDFSDVYFAEKFSQWQQKQHFTAFAIDKRIQKTNHEEIWLTGKNSVTNTNEHIIISVLTGEKPFVFDVRRLLVADREQYTTMEQEMLAFIERFLWNYEVPDENFLLDFLYPSFIQIRYNNMQDKKRVVAVLRNLTGHSIPVTHMEWANKGSEYQIRLTLSKTTDVIDIYVDMQKYLTAFFYDTDIFYTSVQVLKDSLITWVTIPESGATEKSVRINAPSARQALRSVLDTYFAPYRTIISEEDENSIVITAFLNEIEKLRPSEIHYRITAQPAGDNFYSIHSDWSFPLEAEKAVLQADINERAIDLYDLLNQSDVYTSYNTVLHFYSSLGLPVVFQPEIKQIKNFQARFTIHERQPESMTLTEAPKFTRVIRNLARNKICYFFPRNISKEHAQVNIIGYALLLDKTILRGHVLKVNETVQYDTGIQSREIKIDFYPFIRQDNLRSLFAVGDPVRNRKDQIEIQR